MGHPRTVCFIAVAATVSMCPADLRAEPPNTRVYVDPYGDTEVTLERFAAAPGGTPSWDPVCVAPCMGLVDPYDNLRLRLDNGATRQFHVDETAVYRATLRPVSSSKLGVGITLVLASPLILLAAFYTGIETETAKGCRACLVGGGALALGTLATGIALIIFGAGYDVDVAKRQNVAGGPRVSWRGVEF